MKTGIELIAAERDRQIDEEGWTPEHDAQHTDGALAFAAVTYAVAPTRLYMKRESQRQVIFTDVFPSQWTDKSAVQTEERTHQYGRTEKIVTDPIGLLAKAGALIAAEIDRLQHGGTSDAD